MSHLIFCDICNTLIDSNTTFDFVKYVVEKIGGIRKTVFFLFASRYSPFYYGLLIFHRYLHKDLFRQAIVYLLCGISRSHLHDLGLECYQQILRKKINLKVEKLLIELQSSGVLFFLSSSLDPVVSPIAHNYEADYFSSELDYADGKASGTFKIDLTGRKHWVATKIMQNYPGAKITVITDNRSDFDLVKLADRRIIVIHKEEDKIYWKSTSPEYIE